jgi:hypothetical protein
MISFLVEVLLNILKSSTSLKSISKDINFLLSPLLTELIVPELGAVRNTPGFFLSSIIF